MAYRNPYDDGFRTSAHYQDDSISFNPYTDNQPTVNRAYTENQPAVNPYTDNQPASTYYPPVQRAPTSSSVPVAPLRRENSGFEPEEFVLAPGSKNRSVKAMKDYRYGQGNLCTKGGRFRCFGRICCCSLMTTVFLILSIVLALALYIRPPSITIGSVQPLAGSTTSGISTSNGDLSIQLGVDISVTNPNFFAVDFQKIQVELFYPIQNTPVGGGSADNIDFKTRSQTNFTFPFTLTYNSSEPQASAIFSDLATKCGVTGGTKSNLIIDYQITLGIRILMVTISPVISNTFSFPCPISASEISSLLSGLGISNLRRDLD